MADSDASKLRMAPNTSWLMDVIRGVAALVVAAAHVFQVFLLPYLGLGGLPHLLTSLAATYAVLAFFVVSGFMIHWSVLRHTRAGHFDWRGYAVARVLRIYPPLIAAIAITFLVFSLIKLFGLHGSESFRLGGELFVVRERAEFSLQSLLATLFLTYGIFPGSPPPLEMNGPLWTLGYEFWIYFLVMFAINAWHRRLWSGVLPLLVLVTVSLRGGISLQLVFFLVWLCGYALGWLCSSGRIPGRGAVSLVFSAAILLFIAMGSGNLLEQILHPYDHKWSIVAVGAAMTCLIAILAKTVSRSERGWLARSSSYSYSLYVIHFPVQLLGFSLLHPSLHGLGLAWSALAGLGVLCLCVGLARLLSRFVEDRWRIRSILPFFGSGRVSPHA